MRREKSRERKNNEEQWKKQCAEQWERQATALRARRCQADRACLRDLWMSLGAIPTLLFLPLAQIVNTRKNEITRRIHVT
jgi:hypothetical protein